MSTEKIKKQEEVEEVEEEKKQTGIIDSQVESDKHLFDSENSLNQTFGQSPRIPQDKTQFDISKNSQDKTQLNISKTMQDDHDLEDNQIDG